MDPKAPRATSLAVLPRTVASVQSSSYRAKVGVTTEDLVPCWRGRLILMMFGRAEREIGRASRHLWRAITCH